MTDIVCVACKADQDSPTKDVAFIIGVIMGKIRRWNIQTVKEVLCKKHYEMFCRAERGMR